MGAQPVGKLTLHPNLSRLQPTGFPTSPIPTDCKSLEHSTLGCPLRHLPLPCEDAPVLSWIRLSKSQGADGYRGFKPVMLMARAFEVQLRAGSPHLQREGGQRFGQGKGSLAWLTGLELIFFFPWQEFASWSCYVAGKAAPSQASSHF